MSPKVFKGNLIYIRVTLFYHIIPVSFVLWRLHGFKTKGCPVCLVSGHSSLQARNGYPSSIWVLCYQLGHRDDPVPVASSAITRAPQPSPHWALLSGLIPSAYVVLPPQCSSNKRSQVRPHLLGTRGLYFSFLFIPP